MHAGIGCYKEILAAPKRSRPAIGEIHGHLRRGFRMKIDREGPRTGQTSRRMTVRC